MNPVILQNLFDSDFNNYVINRLQRSAEWRLCLDEYYLPGADDEQHSDTGFVYYTYTNDRDWNQINSQDPNRGYFNYIAETIVNTVTAKLDMTNIQIYRLMWNYYNRSSTGVLHQDHRDPGLFSMVYNLSHTDGGTEINGAFYQGQQGTAIIFPSESQHRGFGPSQQPRRFVLNCIFSAQFTDK